MSDLQAWLKSRDDKRKALAYQRKQERDESKREDITEQYFYQACPAMRKEIEKLLQAAPSLPKEELPQHFDNLSKEMQALQKLVSDSAAFLTPYDLRSSQQQIAQLLSDITTKQSQLMPKKFTFKSGRKVQQGEAGPPSNSGSSGIQQGEAGPPSNSGSSGIHVTGRNSAEVSTRSAAIKETVTMERAAEKYAGFQNQSGSQLSLSHDMVTGQDVNLSQLQQCDVQLLGAPSSCHISHLIDCVVFCGPTSSSVFIDYCIKCIFVLACHQLRVHSTQDSAFYIFVTSHPIIEHCHGLKFAPLNWAYPGMDEDCEKVGLNTRVNNWDKVDDFLWLSCKEPSPNWSVLPEEERVTTWSYGMRPAV